LKGNHVTNPVPTYSPNNPYRKYYLARHPFLSPAEASLGEQAWDDAIHFATITVEMLPTRIDGGPLAMKDLILQNLKNLRSFNERGSLAPAITNAFGPEPTHDRAIVVCLALICVGCLPEHPLPPHMAAVVDAAQQCFKGMSSDDLEAKLAAGRSILESIRLPDDASVHIQGLRARMGVTQSYFACCLHVSPTTVHHWEEGLHQPNFHSMCALWWLATAHLPDWNQVQPPAPDPTPPISDWTIVDASNSAFARHYLVHRRSDLKLMRHEFVYCWGNSNWYHRPPGNRVGRPIESHQVPDVVFQDFLKWSKSRTAMIQPPTAPEAPAHP
jgi:DNA-binding transcriptional regulator YiaG